MPMSPAGSVGSMDCSDPQIREILADQLVATVQLTETLKVSALQTPCFELSVVVQVLINYLQVTSAALRLQTDWSPALNTMLTVEGQSSCQ